VLYAVAHAINACLLSLAFYPGAPQIIPPRRIPYSPAACSVDCCLPTPCRRLCAALFYSFRAATPFGRENRGGHGVPCAGCRHSVDPDVLSSVGAAGWLDGGRLSAAPQRPSYRQRPLLHGALAGDASPPAALGALAWRAIIVPLAAALRAGTDDGTVTRRLLPFLPFYLAPTPPAAPAFSAHNAATAPQYHAYDNCLLPN